MLFSSFLLASWILSADCLNQNKLRRHDASFEADYVLRVTYKPTSVACTSKEIAVINNASPGPLLRLQENRVTWVRVYNDMTSDNLTMHWHGLTQAVAPFSDGTPQASQWPIMPGHFFDYEMRPDEGYAGTYYYHSHVGFQAVSAGGPIIVEEAEGEASPYNYDDERILFLSEHYNKTDHDIVEGLTSEEFTWSGETETILVNGQSYPALTAEEAQTTPVSAWTRPPADINQKCGPAVIDVEPGKTYRFRTIGGTALSLVTFSFETHDKLTVISADGTTTQPAKTDHIQIGPGQRFDFLLATKSRSELEELGRTWFWIQLQTADRPTNVTYYAILQYNYKLVKGSDKVVPAARPTTAPLAIPTDLTNWLEYTLSPKEPNGFPSNDQVSRRVFLSNVQIKENNEVWWAINNHTWTEEDMELHNTTYNDNMKTVGTPYLVDIYQNGQAAVPNYDWAVKEYGGWDPRLNVYVARPGEVIDIILLNSPDAVNPGYDSHPWHIHGGHVYDIGSGDGYYSPEEHLRKMGDWQPALRDTTYLYKYPGHEDLSSSKPGQTYGWRAWRLKVSISGVWMVHCHILQHMIMGMQSVWVMGDADDIRSVAQPYVAGYLQYGGSAYGNDTFDPMVYHHFDEDGEVTARRFRGSSSHTKESKSEKSHSWRGSGKPGRG